MLSVLDTSSLNHLIRRERKHRNGNTKNSNYTVLDNYIKSKKIVIVLDSGRNIISEWERTCGIYEVRAILVQWSDFNGIKLIEEVPRLSPTISRKLRAMGFVDTLDKFLVRVVVAVEDRNIISEDSDFWDPRNSRKKGRKNAPVALYLKDQLDINVYLLGQIIKRLKS